MAKSSPPPDPEPDPLDPGDLSEIGSLLGGLPTFQAARDQARRRPHDLTERLHEVDDEPAPPEPRPRVERPAVKWVGRYEILGELGRGGMGVVYHALQPGLNRPVALKMVLAGAHADPDDLERFYREAEAVARLQHPNIVQVYEVGQHEGCPYFTMEYVEGGGLTRMIGGKPQPPRACAELVEVLSRAVQYAHDQGIVHRDLKPANILLAARSSAPDSDTKPHAAVPKIVDFGLAKQLDALDNQTRSGDIVGTPSYMAPEQARGERYTVGPAVDVYGLGTILYEMLTGRAPFLGATEVDTLRQVISDEPVSPSRSQPAVPLDLSTICLKCLHKIPARRYATAFDLGEDLRRFLRGEPIKARPVGLPERAWRWCRRRPTLAALCASLVMLFGSMFFGVTLLWLVAEAGQLREADLRRSAERAEAEAEAQLYFSRIALADRELAVGHVADAEELLGQCPEPLRGWEWGYLLGQCRTELASRKAHDPWATAVAFAAGRLVSAGGNPFNKKDAGQFAVWPPGDGLGEPVTVRLPTLLTSVTCSPDGNLAAAVGANGRLYLFDLPDATPSESPLNGHKPVTAVAFSPDGRLLAAAGDGVALWEVATGRERLRMAEPHRDVKALAFSPRGDLVVTVGDRQLRVWGTDDGRPRKVIDDVTANRLTFSPNSRLLAAAGGSVRVWDADTWHPRLASDRHNGDVYAVAFSPDGRLLATGGVDQLVRVMAVRSGREVLAFRGHEEGAVRDVAFAPDGTYLASAGQDGTVKMWDLTRNPRGLSVARTPELWGGEWVGDMALTPDGSQVLRANQDVGSLEVVAVDTDIGVRSFFLDLQRDFAILRETCAFSSDGRFLAGPTASDPRVVQVWDARDGRVVRALPPRPRPVRCVALSRDGRLLAVGTGGRDPVGVWVVEEDDRPPVLMRDLERPRSLAFSPDGGRLAGSADGQAVHVWDLRGRESVRTAARTGEREIGLTFAPDAGQLAVIDWTARAVRVLRTDTMADALVHPLRVPTAPTGVAFSPDGRRVAVVSYDGETRLFDAATGQEVLTLRSLGENRPDDYGFPARVAFSADGRRLASSTWDARVNVYDAGSGPRDRWDELRRRESSWRLWQARAALAEQDRFAFGVHRKHLEAMQSDEVSLLAARGRLWASLDEWERADADLGRAWRLSPGDARLGYELSCVKLRLGQRRQHREICDALWERFGSTTAPWEGHFVLRAWLLVDDAPGAAVWPTAVKWARDVLGADRENRLHRQRLAAALLRAGRHAEAEEVVIATLRDDPDDRTQALSWTLLALTQNHHGWFDNGGRSLAKGRALLERARASRPAEAFAQNAQVPDWGEWLALERWGEEAAEVLSRKSASDLQP